MTGYGHVEAADRYGPLMARMWSGDPSAKLELALYLTRTPDRVTPRMLPAPDGMATSAISAIDTGNQSIIGSVLENKGTAAAFSKYREQLTWIEADNSRRLELLSWAWETAKESSAADGDVGDQAARALERIALDAWNLDRLSTERGWAERQCRSRLLSSAARLAAVSGK